MKVKTIISRISDSDVFDKEIEKNVAMLKEEGQELKDIKTSCGQHYLVCQLFTEEKNTRGKPRSTKA